jgi:hypothetical protein
MGPEGSMTQQWAKVAGDLDLNPKVIKAGRLGREVFLFALRRNAIRYGRYEVEGVIPESDLDHAFMAHVLMMPEAEAAAGLEAAIAAKLIARRTDGTFIIRGFDDTWNRGGAMSNAERQRRFRDRRNGDVTRSVTRDVTALPEREVDLERRSEEEQSVHTSPPGDRGPGSRSDATAVNRDKVAQFQQTSMFVETAQEGSGRTEGGGPGRHSDGVPIVAPRAQEGARIEGEGLSAKPKRILPDEALTLASLLMGYVVQNAPDGRLAKKTDAQREQHVERWAVPIEALHRIDKQSWGAIDGAIHWVFRDPFWRSVIQGGDNLRSKWDTIAGQRARGRDRVAPRKSPTEQALADVERLEAEEQAALAAAR